MYIPVSAGICDESTKHVEQGAIELVYLPISLGLVWFGVDLIDIKQLIYKSVFRQLSIKLGSLITTDRMLSRSQ